MLIEDLITRAPVTIREGSRLSQVAGQMARMDVGSVVVVTDTKDPVGIITDRDIALFMADGVADIKVEQIMSPHPVFVPRGTDVEECIERMRDSQVRRILVLDEDGDLIGVVSLDDIMMHVADMLGRAGSLIRAEVANV
ncbi:MAG TPA: CBS domain-containing protein, partial [Gemmatimonadota bacterium]|nr:CBS domain-containing protein [Gemmatimonadota bacterium]